MSVYKKWAEEHPYDNANGNWIQPYSHKDMPLSDDVVKKAALKNDAAVIIIGRNAGEGYDCAPCEGSYYITKTEEEMIKSVCENFEKVALLLNVGGIIDLGFAEKYNIGSIMYIWQGGEAGADAVCDVLSGKISPSGKLCDTQARRLEDYPFYNYIGDDKKITLPYANGASNGVLSSTDWSKFNNVAGAVTSVTASNSATNFGVSTNILTIPMASTTNVEAGLLSNTDYVAFEKVTGAVTSAKFATNVLQPTIASNVLSIPIIGSNTSATVGVVYYSDWHRFNTTTSKAVTAVKFGDTAATIDKNELIIPMASATTTAGLLSSDDYKSFKAVSDILGTANESDKANAIDKIYEVFEFLAEYDTEVDLATMLNNRAILNEVAEGAEGANVTKYSSNTFNVKNIFNNETTFNGIVYFDDGMASRTSSIYFGYEVTNGSAVQSGDNTTIISRGSIELGYYDSTANKRDSITITHDGIKLDNKAGTIHKLYFPIKEVLSDEINDDTVGVNYLTAVYHYDDDNKLEASPVLKECQAITADLFTDASA